MLLLDKFLVVDEVRKVRLIERDAYSYGITWSVSFNQQLHNNRVQRRPQKLKLKTLRFRYHKKNFCVKA